MSKYTTELRYIVEMEGGETESKGYNSIAEIIEKARPKIFNFSYPIFDENYKAVIETKILKRFYTREIGLETYGLWKLKLDAKLNEIMPYYNKLYESELIEFNPIYATNITKAYSGNKSSNTSSNGNDTSNSIMTTQSATQNANVNKYSDTPQGGLVGIENDTYLTSATIDNQSANGTSNGTTQNTSTKLENKTGNETDAYIETITGYNGYNPNKLLTDFRKNLLNIDIMILNDLEDLFMLLW